jgi:cytokinin riboside 5'-monophosphate phosphoribohydrolase
MAQNICVYCASSDAIDARYIDIATEMGARIAKRGDTLVYGGASKGMMGAVARSTQRHGGRVVGIIPQSLVDLELAYTDADELVITKDMRERKGLLETRSDAFVALPGGLGTLEEVMEILTLKQLRLTTKPLVLLNVEGLYEPLFDLFAHLCELKFLKSNYPQLYHASPDLEDVFAYLDAYHPVLPEPKF